ncbi:hypothetical protein MMC14_007909 [Varicellaria rhodocarpa]|nr:hypothetical protein [Varicellaria rhodocarpa]
MDPLSAIGVASSIIQFVDLGMKVATRLKEYNSATTDIPRSLQHISAQLPLLLSALDRMKTGVEVEKVDLDTRCILKGVVSGCKQQVEKVDKIIAKVLHVPGDSLVTKVQKVFVGLKNDEKVLAIEKNLQTYIQVLILHHLIEGPDTSSGTSEDTLYFEVPVRQASPFHERVELLQEIETQLYPAATSQVSNPVMIGLSGQERAGKTQLAVAFCHQAKAVGQFQTIFWLNANTPENLSRSIESISDIVRRSKEGLKDREEKMDFANKFLTNRWHPWLLVLDNYDPTKFQNVLDFLPSHGSGAILFTCRSESFLHSGHIIRVPKFRDPDEINQLRHSLRDAVYANKSDDVNSLLADGADPDTREYNENMGRSCLSRAIESENETMVRLFLSRGAITRPQDSGYRTALYRAASIGNISIFQLILDHEDALGLTQAPVNNAALVHAAEKGHEGIVRMILLHGSLHVDTKWTEKTPLGLAAKNGHTAVVQLLLDFGANPEAESEEASPLTLAAKSLYLEIVKLLHKSRNAQVNVGDFTSYTRYSPLYYAIEHQNPFSHDHRDRDNMVKYLLESGADPNRSAGGKDVIPLQLASSRGHINVVSMLLEYGAHPYPPDCEASKSPICKAAERGYEEAVKVLFKAQAETINPEVRDEHRKKALIYASISGHRSVVLALVDAGVDINTAGYLGKTPLLFAIEKDQIPTARLLLRRGADINLTDANGNSPLFLAVEKGSDLIVREILRSGGRSDVQNADGETPLCLATLKGHEKVVKALLENGADREATNKFGDTPLDLAMEKDHKSIVEILENGR